MPAIEIVPYHPGWPTAFAELGKRIRGALDGLDVAIHHIGSTSVPGLPAKDVLDLQLSVASLELPLEAPLARLGFEERPHLSDHLPPGFTLPEAELAKRFFKRVRPEANLHVRVRGSFNQRYALLFRDYLRAVPAAAHAYGEIKHQLARRFAEDMAAYYDIKDPVCDAIMAGAWEWARATGWSPGPSEA